MYPSIKTSDSLTRTIRLDAKIDDMFKEMAGREQVSVNQLVTKAMTRYGEWDVYADKFDFVSISGKVLTRLFNSLSDEEARQLGRDVGNNTALDLVNFYFKKYDHNTVLRILELLGDSYARMYTLEKTVKNDGGVMIFKHGRGPRVSAYLAEMVKTLLGRLNLKTDAMETQDQTVITISNWQKGNKPFNQF